MAVEGLVWGLRWNHRRRHARPRVRCGAICTLGGRASFIRRAWQRARRCRTAAARVGVHRTRWKRCQLGR